MERKKNMTRITMIKMKMVNTFREYEEKDRNKDKYNGDEDKATIYLLP